MAVSALHFLLPSTSHTGAGDAGNRETPMGAAKNKNQQAQEKPTLPRQGPGKGPPSKMKNFYSQTPRKNYSHTATPSAKAG